MRLRNVALGAACAVVGVLVALGAAIGAGDQPGSGTKLDYLQGHRPNAGPTPAAGGDSCSAAVAIDALPFTDTGDTTGAASTTDTIPPECNGLFSTVAGPDHIYSFVVGESNLLNFTVSTADPTYDPSIYITETCGKDQICVIGADNCFGNDIGMGCPDSSEAITNSFPPGLYFFYVDSYYASSNADGRGDGAYTLSVTGNLPAELIEFTVD